MDADILSIRVKWKSLRRDWWWWPDNKVFAFIGIESWAQRLLTEIIQSQKSFGGASPKVNPTSLRRSPSLPWKVLQLFGGLLKPKVTPWQARWASFLPKRAHHYPSSSNLFCNFSWLLHMNRLSNNHSHNRFEETRLSPMPSLIFNIQAPSFILRKIWIEGSLHKRLCETNTRSASNCRNIARR